MDNANNVNKIKIDNLNLSRNFQCDKLSYKKYPKTHKMSNKRKFTIDFTELLDVIYDKIDSHQLQEYLNEMLDDLKSSDDKIHEFEKTLRNISSIIPGIGNTFEEFEDNVRNGNIVDMIELATNVFRKGLTSGQFENTVSDTVKNISDYIEKEIIPKKRKM